MVGAGAVPVLMAAVPARPKLGFMYPFESPFLDTSVEQLNFEEVEALLHSVVRPPDVVQLKVSFVLLYVDPEVVAQSSNNPSMFSKTIPSISSTSLSLVVSAKSTDGAMLVILSPAIRRMRIALFGLMLEFVILCSIPKFILVKLIVVLWLVRNK